MISILNAGFEDSGFQGGFWRSRDGSPGATHEIMAKILASQREWTG